MFVHPSKWLVLATLIGLLPIPFVSAEAAGPTCANGVPPGGWICSGDFVRDDQAQLLSFDVAANATRVRILTTSYANGNFDPLLTLFDPWGLMVDSAVPPVGYLNDDADNGAPCSGKVPTDPNTRQCLDALWEGTLPAGRYWLVLTVSNNLARTRKIADGFNWQGQAAASAVFGCPGGIFCDVAGNDRAGHWGLTLEGVGTAAAWESVAGDDLGAFTLAANRPPRFVSGPAPVTVLLQPGEKRDLREFLAVKDGDTQQTLVWSVVQDINAQALNGAVAVLESASAITDGTEGDFSPPPGSVMYTAKAGFSGGDGFIVQVSDGTDVAVKRFDIRINAPTVNLPPEAHAVAVGGGNIRAGGQKSLYGGYSFDPERGGMRYTWAQIAGPPVMLTGAHEPEVSFTAPTNAVGQSIVVRLTVEDQGQPPLSASTTVEVTVTGDNQAPIVTPINMTAREGQDVILSAEVVDPDGDPIVAYHWRQIGGTPQVLGKVDGPVLGFRAPVGAGVGGSLIFSLTATDGFGPQPLSATGTVTLNLDRDPTLLDCSRAFPAVNGLNVWPPDRSFLPVSIVGLGGPEPQGVIVTDVSSDEPVRDVKAGDRTGPDARIRKGRLTRKSSRVDHVLVRAERQRKRRDGTIGNGRVYTIGFRASHGNQVCTGRVKVGIPARPGIAAVEDESRYNVLRAR